MKILVSLALLAGLLACVPGPKCPVDGTGATYQSQTYVNGKQVNTYKCAQGHIFTVVC
jgi:hypothetical protein